MNVGKWVLQGTNRAARFNPGSFFLSLCLHITLIILIIKNEKTMKTIERKKTKCYLVEVTTLDFKRIDFDFLTTDQLDYLLKKYRVVKDEKSGNFYAPRSKFDDFLAFCPFKFIIRGSTYKFTGEAEERRMEKICKACNQYLSQIIYENE